MHHGVASHEAVCVGRGTGPDHAVDRVHHDESAPDDGQHLRGSLRKQRLGYVQVNNLSLPFAKPEREHAKDAARQAD
ncbi:hypothetical protein GCM10023346_35660 [Arthrobacter gyeryongensis]|uniref:Uncharacterized protein n=1 Tax=Arthrobacter gyeryongensis TaxID=1650592 RepID=A0ABP9SL90_9MICC